MKRSIGFAATARGRIAARERKSVGDAGAIVMDDCGSR